MTRGQLLIAAVVLVVLVAGGALALNAPPRGPAFTNPVLRHDAPDPSVIEADDGFYYTYTTQSAWPTLENVPVLRSKDLVHWKHVGDALPELPRWVTTDVWAPHIIRIGDTYNLYISARQFGSAGFAIGVATSSSPTGPFEGRPKPILRGPRFTTIDPFVMSTRGDKIAEDVGEEALGLLEAQVGENKTIFVARLGARTEAAVGKRIEVAIDTRNLHFFDPETGQGIY